MSTYITYLKNVAFIQLLKLYGVSLLYVNCRIYRQCKLTVVPYRRRNAALKDGTLPVRAHNAPLRTLIEPSS